jgi:hypothetical protein
MSAGKKSQKVAQSHFDHDVYVHARGWYFSVLFPDSQVDEDTHREKRRRGSQVDEDSHKTKRNPIQTTTTSKRKTLSSLHHVAVHTIDPTLEEDDSQQFIWKHLDSIRMHPVIGCLADQSPFQESNIKRYANMLKLILNTEDGKCIVKCANQLCDFYCTLYAALPVIDDKAYQTLMVAVQRPKPNSIIASMINSTPRLLEYAVSYCMKEKISITGLVKCREQFNAMISSDEIAYLRQFLKVSSKYWRFITMGIILSRTIGNSSTRRSYSKVRQLSFDELCDLLNDYLESIKRGKINSTSGGKSAVANWWKMHTLVEITIIDGGDFDQDD